MKIEKNSKAKKAVVMAKGHAYDNLYARLETKEAEKELYRLARHRDREEKDVQHVRVIKDENGKFRGNVKEMEGVRGLFKKYPTFLYKAHNTINFASFIQSPSKYSPWWFTHLSQRFCHFSKHFINSSPGML